MEHDRNKRLVMRQGACLASATRCRHSGQGFWVYPRYAKVAIWDIMEAKPDKAN